MKNIDIKKIYIGYEKMDNDLFREIIECAQNEGIPIVMLKKGSRIFIDANAYFEILNSETMLGENAENENELSLVNLLNYYGKKILFTGDIESQGEKYLCENYDFKVDILKVPHHGSKTSSNINFIDKFNPKHGIILVGKNSFGHPSDEVLDRYEENHTSIYRTDDLGMIKVVLRPNGYNIEGFKKEKLSFFGVLMKYGIYIDFTIFYLILSYVILKKYSYLFRELKVLEY
jgi:competence protein ComEC